ncbi:hypothetical protein DSCA_30300 [Desulfosarcina alkanivorans]|uniref:Uncharacterized protein n=1 Tax=Desulfosarcina alkanivorans TaxID=571177 RepID=A0A5K7YLL0_9BACT|nr:hypothetical protein [Desulfosarcina alkanivorans]BBO69100.1 hypothetical protein DSCA_30300 [Desulfosarcina alkanivorans]
MDKLSQANKFFNDLAENLKDGENSNKAFRQTIENHVSSFYPEELPYIQRTFELQDEDRPETTGPPMIDVDLVNLF